MPQPLLMPPARYILFGAQTMVGPVLAGLGLGMILRMAALRDVTRDTAEMRLSAAEAHATLIDLGREFELTPENQEKIIKSEKALIKESLAKSQLKNQNRRQKILVVTTWRSGSTFLGELLSSYPGVFLAYEPLFPVGVHQLRKGRAEVGWAMELLQDVLHCRLNNSRFLSYMQQEGLPVTKSKALEKYCSGNRTLRQSNRKQRQRCRDSPHFLNALCSVYPVVVAKVVRLRMEMAGDLIEKEGMDNLRVIYLARDPRGTMQSRLGCSSWCSKEYPDCSDPRYLCRDLEEDHKAAADLRRRYPGRVKVVRYETMMSDVVSQSRSLFAWLGLDFDHEEVQEFVRTHTSRNTGGPTSTFRDSATTPYRWRQLMTRPTVKAVQNSCSRAMKLWGYRSIDYSNGTEISNDEIVQKLDLEE